MHKIHPPKPSNCISVAIFLAVSSLLFSFPASLLAQIDPDNTLGDESSQVVPVTPEADAIIGGATRGSNLFHSFKTFNIDEGRAAYFVPDTDIIRTIFSRVTGGDPSQILGTLGVVGDANLFLINPAGIVFGANAKLDLSGSFIASTANSIAFPDGQLFSATNPNAPPLLTIDVPVPIGLQFESGDRGIILNQGDLTTGQNIALVGGAIANSGQITASGKDIILSTVPAGVNSVVQLDGTGKFIGQTQSTGQPNTEAADIFLVGGKIDATSEGTAGNIILNSAGNIALTDGALVDVRGSGGGNIKVNAQNIEMSGGSQIRAGIGDNLGSLGAQAGNIVINTAESAKIQGDLNTSVVIGNTVGNGSVGNAGEVSINTGTLEGSGSFAIGSFTFGQGNAGRVIINAKDAVSLDSLGGNGSGIVSAVGASATGNGGDIEIDARSLSLLNGAFVSTTTLGEGKGGNITVNASESVQLVGNSANGTPNFLITGTTGQGKAGDLFINTGQLLVRDGARIGTDTDNAGNGGNLTVNASESVQLIGTSAQGRSSSLTTLADLNSTGKAGNLNLNTRQLLVRDGAAIATTTAGEGDGGNLSVNASDSVQLIGTSPNGSLFSNLNTITGGGGKAGNLVINTRQLLVREGAAIATTTIGEGDGGNLSVNASESVQVSGISAGQSLSALATGATGKGKAGDLTINTRQLLVENGGRIAADTEAEGDGGDLTINAAESVRLLGTFSNLGGVSSQTFGSGNAGDIEISTRQLLVQDGAVVSTATAGEGEAGNLTIDASESVELNGISSDGLFASRLTSLSLGKSKAGDVLINTGRLLVQSGAGITTGTQGEGDGGNLLVNASESVQLIGTSVNSFSLSNLNTITIGGGRAGDLTLNTRQLLIQDGAAISTSTQGTGDAGTLTVNASESIQLIGTGQFANIQFPSSLISNTISPATGKAGDINLNTRQLLIRDGALISSGTDSSGDGGNISVKAETLSLIDGALLFASTSGTGDAGDINIDVDKEVIISGLSPTPVASLAFIPSAIFSTVEIGAEGDGGTIAVKAESLTLETLGTVITSSYGRGDAGDISIQVDDFVRLNNAGFIASNVETGGIGTGGNIDIQARSLTLSDGGEIQAGLRAADSQSPGGVGTGGNIRINASDFVDIFGVNTTQFPIIDPSDPSSIAAPRGISSGIFGSTQQGANGSAGNILITTKAFRLADGAVVEAQTANLGDAGDITINANTFEVTGGGQLITATRGSGNAGNIVLNVTDSVTLSGSDSNFDQRLKLLAGNTAQFTNISPSSGLFANTTEGSTGRGGSIFIDPRIVSVKDGATVSVNSQGAGVGGQIAIAAGSLTLDKGTISAQTASTTGGNITLNVQDLLLLRNGSQISTTAGTAQAGGDGGNIIINAGAIVANPLENSDISANAFLGRGGRIQISTNAIFGLDFRQKLTPLSDITASSEAGLAGTVEINTSGIDPTRGLEALTEERINAEVTQGCQVGASGEGTLSFYNLGRGGTPPSPDDLLNSPMTGEWLSLELEENQNTNPESQIESQSQEMNKMVWLTCQIKNRL